MKSSRDNTKKDIINHLSKKFSNRSEKELERLKDHDWPGNIRELEHTIEKAVILSERGSIATEHLLPKLSPASALPSKDTFSLEENERLIIERAVKTEYGNISAAAKKLGLTLRALRYRLEKFGLDNKQK